MKYSSTIAAEAANKRKINQMQTKDIFKFLINRYAADIVNFCLAFILGFVTGMII